MSAVLVSGCAGHGIRDLPGRDHRVVPRDVGVRWLEVTIARRLTAVLPQLPGVRDPAWDLHRADANLAFADLVELVAGQSDAWAARGDPPPSP